MPTVVDKSALETGSLELQVTPDNEFTKYVSFLQTYDSPSNNCFVSYHVEVVVFQQEASYISRV